MRPHLAALLALAVTALPIDASAQDPSPPPSPEDVPRPVPVEIGLAGDERPDVARFLNVRTAFAPSLSPDGSTLAFRTQITGEPQLWVVDAESGWPHQITFAESVTFHAFSPTGEWIAYGSDRGGNEREGYWLISPDGTEERELLAPSDAFRVFGAFTKDGRHILYATTERNGVDFDIHRLDVETGVDEEILRGRMGLYVASVAPDGSKVLLTESRGEDAEDVMLFDVETAALDTLFAPEDRAAHGSFAWTPEGRGFFLSTNQGREHAGLAFHDLSTSGLEWVETPDRDVEDVKLSHDGRYLVWTTNEGGYSALHARDLSSGTAVETPDLPRGTYSVTWADDASVTAIHVEGPRVPGDVWTWSPETGGLRRATESDAAGLDLSKMVVPEPHDFPARDGVTLHGLLYLPRGAVGDGPAADDGFGAGRPPVLLTVHGGPTSQARPDFDAVTQYLLTRGIAVFDLDYRGSTGHGKSFARLNDGRGRAVEYLDMEDAVRWLGEEGLVDASRATVMGGSYGGYLTMAAMTRLPGVFDAGVAFVGVSNWVTALEGASPQLKASDRIEYGDIDDPDDRAFFESISPIAHVANVVDPVMVVHGANDPRDPVTESDQFVRGIRERGGTVEYLRFPDEGHGIRKLENRLIAYRRVADFLERRLGIAGAAANE